MKDGKNNRQQEMLTPHPFARAQTHIFLVRITRSAQFIHWSAFFHCGHTALAQGKKESVSRISLHSFLSHCCGFVGGPLGRFPLLLLPQTLSVIDLLERSRVTPLCLRSLEWNVWLLGQSDSTLRLWAQLLQLHEWGAHAVTEVSRAATTPP